MTTRIFRKGPACRFVWCLALLFLATLLPIGPLTAFIPSTIAAPLAFPIDITINEYGNVSGLALGDFDGDGTLDVVTGQDGRNSGVYLNDGTGRFAERLYADAQNKIVGVAVGDLDNDGDLDFVAVSSGQQSRVFYNSGAAVFTSAPVGPANLEATSVALGDMDDNGTLDLVIGARDGGTVYLRGADGSYGAAHTFGAGQPISSVALGNLWGTSSLEIIAARGLPCFDQVGCTPVAAPGRVYYRDPSGSAQPFASSLNFSGAVVGSAVALGDLDGDGLLDIVQGVEDGQTVAYFGDPSSSFALAIPVGAASQATRSLALGDVSGDGSLDIFTGVYGGGSRLHVNDGSGVFSPLAGTYSGSYTSSVALGDMDGDGHLDIVLGDRHYALVVLSNGANRGYPGETVADSPSWATAWGDINGDGFLDQVVGNANGQLIVYRTMNGIFIPGNTYALGGLIQAIAPGDLDGDTDLDVVVARLDTPLTVLINTNGSLADSGRGYGAAAHGYAGLALGDLDGDGDLDMVAGSSGQGQLEDGEHIVLLNDGSGGFSQSQVFAEYASSLALGDLDGDGDLDMVAGALGAYVFVQLNQGNGQFAAPFALNDIDAAADIALGDLDGDGDLDIVAGNNPQPDALYLNDGAGRFPQRQVLTSSSSALALGDMDGDGDPDLVAGGHAAQSAIYLNNNGFQALSAREFGLPGDATADIALGDMDGNGTLDLATASTAGESLVILNALGRSSDLPNSEPGVAIRLPLATDSAPGFSSPITLAGPTVPLTILLSDREGDPVRRLRVEYSINGGGKWLEAKPTAATMTANLAASPQGTPHSYEWDLFASGLFGQNDDVILRAVVTPGVAVRPSSVAGPFQRPYVSGLSAQFRVQGTQVRVVRGGEPAPGATVFRIPAGQTRGAAISAADGRTLKSDSRGLLPGRGALGIGDRLVALLPIFASTPDERSGYTLYHTSAPTATAGLNAFTVGQPGVQTLAVSPAHPLVLFHLKVSLEWDARADSAYMSQLRADLQRTSELLYGWSDGQIALGNVTIYHNKQEWANADVRIFATNRLRPNASLGGIVTAPFTETLSVGGAQRSLFYEPGQIRMGTVWSRYGGTSGAAGGEDWARALGHEIGHYALFLDENYLGLDSAGRLINVESCPSPMADVYRDDNAKFHPDAGWLPRCADTLSNRNTGRSDWRTIKARYDSQADSFTLNMPASYNLDSGPSLLPIAVTTVSEVAPAGASASLPTQLYSLETASGSIYQVSGRARAFLFSEAPGVSPNDALIDLGQPDGDDVLAYGARPDDRLCVFDLDVDALGCEPIKAGDTRVLMSDLTARPWKPTVLITPVASRTLELDVSGVPAGLALRARLYPLSGGAPSEIATLGAATGAYRGTLSADEAVLSAFVHLWVEEAEPRRELVVDFGLGGNPTKNKGTGKDKNTGKGKKAPALSPDGQVVLFGEALEFASGTFYSIQSLASLPAPAPRWTTPVGQSYRLLASAGAPDLSQASISVGYYDADLPAGTEAGLALYYLADGAQSWRRLPTSLDAGHNEAVASAQGPGSYVLMTALELSPGWNILSYPWPQRSMPVGDAMALLNAQGGFTTIYGYDPGASADRWQVYDVDAPAWVNDLQHLAYGRGYWVRVQADGAVAAQAGRAALAGALPQPPSTFYGALEGGASGQLVRALIDGQVCGTTTARAVDGAVVFVIDVPAAAEQAGCGLPGRLVRFESDGAVFAVGTWQGERPTAVTPGDQLPRPYRLFMPLLRR